MRYYADSLGWVNVGKNAAFTYPSDTDLTKSGNRLLTKEEVHAIVDNIDVFKAAIEKTGFKPLSINEDDFNNLAAENILYKGNGQYEWYDGKDVLRQGGTASGRFLPIVARTFTK